MESVSARRSEDAESEMNRFRPLQAQKALSGGFRPCWKGIVD